jgi:hypothetical protein
MMPSLPRTSYVVATVVAIVLTARAGLAQSAAPRDADPKCSLGTIRQADGFCRSARHVVVELQYAGADRRNVWRAIQTGARNRNYDILEPTEAGHADTKATGKMRVMVQPRRVTITAELRGARGLSQRCDGSRVVARSFDTSHVNLGALLVQSGQSLMSCFDELWTTAEAVAAR